ncbi:MAG: major royal jelly family protein [Acidobacteriota bacterium]|nr:major royal jelly family protein [Acidobacteriota bacterium]
MISTLGACLAACACAQSGKTVSLTEVYKNNDFQLTGISVSKTGRLFVNFPRWSDRYLNAVIEVMPDGSVKPFPDKEWNQWDLKPATAGNHFVCVQSVVVDDSDALWILDPAAPALASVVPGGAKIVKVDLKTNQVSRVISFGPDVALPDSYLNDVRFDLPRHTAYMTDSGHGGLVILDLESGKAHRALDRHPSVLVEQGVQVVVDGKQLLANGKPPQFNADGIALSPDGEYVYYKPVTAKTLYRVKTETLRDPNASPESATSAVEKVATTFPTDGLWMDKNRNLYLSDVEHNAVTVFTPDGKLQRIATDNRLQWPDTFSEGPDGAIFISASHINDSPTYNQGKSTRTQPYMVFKFKP